ncbi:MAG TPA: L,D-transpeptidase, partial [Solirubrobacteraceae bacterium]|nr:L,D-transpeptidase [Solirubrobacteraceae bacterium]
PPAAPAAPVPDVTLSDEHSRTTWAHPVDELPIYTLADPHAHRITHTHLLTEDGFAEIYMVLSSHVDAAGRKWLKIRIPGRPNGREGWVSSEALGNLHVTHWAIVINRARETLTVYDDGRRRYVAPVGVGKPSTPTPPGHFWIRERFKLTNPKNPYFPYALGTSDYSTLSEWPGGGVVGIHGPFGEPGRIPGHPSHGCVRMLDKGIAWVGAHVNLGTPVRII